MKFSRDFSRYSDVSDNSNLINLPVEVLDSVFSVFANHLRRV